MRPLAWKIVYRISELRTLDGNEKKENLESLLGSATNRSTVDVSVDSADYRGSNTIPVKLGLLSFGRHLIKTEFTLKRFITLDMPLPFE